MKLAYFPKQTALQSEPVWRAFLQGAKTLGITPVEDAMDADCAVIWSVLWQGRMRKNQAVYNHYRSQGKPVFIIEVGALDRGRTWKISVNNITAAGEYANDSNFELDRAGKLGIDLGYSAAQSNPAILIVGQHQHSLQWAEMDTVAAWVNKTVNQLRTLTDRPIVFRPHPRNLVRLSDSAVHTERPTKLPNTYDKFDINFNYHCIVSYNSGPGIQSAVAGTPIICHHSSLAYPISEKIENINHPSLPDRSVWFQQILHTEWTIEEIAQGIPQRRILCKIELDIS